MPPISIDIAPCLRLVNNEITLSAAVSLARRYARDGCWEVERLERQPLAALLAYACNLTALGADGCAEVIYKTAGLIGRDDEEVRAALRALPLRAAVTKDEIQLAYRLLRKGVPGLQLATAVRRAKLGLGESPQFCERQTLCDRGVVLGCETVIAPLNELPGERLGLKVDGRAEEILALLSIARGAPTPTDVLDRLNGVSRALQRGNRVLAEMELALVGQPVLAGRAAAEALAKTADAL